MAIGSNEVQRGPTSPIIVFQQAWSWTWPAVCRKRDTPSFPKATESQNRNKKSCTCIYISPSTLSQQRSPVQYTWPQHEQQDQSQEWVLEEGENERRSRKKNLKITFIGCLSRWELADGRVIKHASWCFSVVSRTVSFQRRLDSQTEFVLFHASSIPGKMICSLSFVFVPPLPHHADEKQSRKKNAMLA